MADLHPGSKPNIPNARAHTNPHRAPAAGQTEAPPPCKKECAIVCFLSHRRGVTGTGGGGWVPSL
eukprot:6949160-Alexandrium_andersonii.AAC.1